MSAPPATLRRWRAWPRTMAARLFMIFLVGLVLAHTLSFALLFYERYDSARSLMLNVLERDVGTAIAILDRVPAAERAAWLPRLAMDNRHYALGRGEPDGPLVGAAARTASEKITQALKGAYPVAYGTVAGDARRMQAHVVLGDGMPVVIALRLGVMPLADWLPTVLVVQLLLLVGCAWFAVHVAVRPLTVLARAADDLDPNRKSPRLDEQGPAEVAHAAVAFNAMQDRIASHLTERMQILGAISHDLQTPITRMKLRAEFMEDSVDKDKLAQDLDEVERLVREGVAYARSSHGVTEMPVRIDLDAFLDSLVCDYQDTGKDVRLSRASATPLMTRPHALRRILGNLIDNALKFAGAAEVRVDIRDDGGVTMSVRDRGPGIPPQELAAVLQPFYRLEGSRNRDTGGTGLGLAIAQQLVLAVDGSLRLVNRDGGGLSAEVRLSPAASRAMPPATPV